MPKRKQPRLPTALTLLALTVCPPIMRVTPTAAPTTNKATPADVVLSNSDNGTVVTLAQGQSLKLTLEAHPTTGYAWQVVEAESDILQQAGEATYTRANPLGTSRLGQEDVQAFRYLPLLRQCPDSVTSWCAWGKLGVHQGVSGLDVLKYEECAECLSRSR